ncbi:MAG TPA: type VI secretion system baseplate subunit TssK [Polyangia bacterium]
MKLPQRVFWTEGMLMSPQHLQQQDLYHERLLAARFETASPYAWGVVDMAIDPGALGRGEIRLASFSGVLSDGTVVMFDVGSSDAVPTRPIGDHYPGGQPQPLEVYLAVPREREGAPSFAPATNNGGGMRSRYATVNRRVADLGDVGSQIDVSFGRNNLTILFGDEPRDDFASVKIAEVARDGTGSLALVPTYVPPCLRTSGSAFLMESLRRVLGLLLGKQRELSDRRRQRDASTLEFDAADVTLFLQLNALNGLIPVLKHVSDTGDMTPYELYLLLSQGAGQLTTFSTEVEPLDLPAFVFTDLRSTFEQLFAMLTLLVRQTVKEAHVKVDLTVKNGIHFGALEGEQFARCRQYVLAVRAENVPEEQVAERLPTRSKIASWKDLEPVLRGSKPGVPLRVTHRPPAQIPVRAGVVYFLLDVNDGYWKQVLQERRVGIYLPAPFDPGSAAVELFAIPDGG